MGIGLDGLEHRRKYWRQILRLCGQVANTYVNRHDYSPQGADIDGNTDVRVRDVSLKMHLFFMFLCFHQARFV